MPPHPLNAELSVLQPVVSSVVLSFTFFCSLSVWVKRFLAADLAVVSNKDAKSALDVWNIGPNVSLAAAYIACKQHAEAVSLLDPALTLCIEWLTDDFVENHSSTIRLLARLLACVGLEKNSSITCSAQSSLISKETPEPAAEAKVEVDIKTDQLVRKSHVKRKFQQKLLMLKKIPCHQKNSTGRSTCSTQPTCQTTTCEKSPNDAKSIASSPRTKKTSGGVHHTGTVAAKVSRTGSKMSPFYMCLTCYNMDLCKECPAKRIALDGQAAGSETTKLTFCGENHDHVKTPVDGWGDVKDGILSIGHQRFEFTHWLDDDKEKWEDWKDMMG